MNWTLIYDEAIPPDTPPEWTITPRNLAPPFTWLQIWQLVLDDGQRIRRYQYSRPA